MFLEAFPSRGCFFVSPFLGFYFCGGCFFSGNGTLSSPGDIFRIPGGILAQLESIHLCTHRSVVRASPVELFFLFFSLYGF